MSHSFVSYGSFVHLEVSVKVETFSCSSFACIGARGVRLVVMEGACGREIGLGRSISDIVDEAGAKLIVPHSTSLHLE